MKILIAYESLSGHTQVLANYIFEQLKDKYSVEIKNILLDDKVGNYDLYLLGTWTCGLGETPANMKTFCQSLPNGICVAAFGTGETQWGMDYFCGAARRIANHFKSPYPVLRIEQMLANDFQKTQVNQWLAGIFNV
jgi:predicted ribonucleotide reductase-associated flavodoxin